MTDTLQEWSLDKVLGSGGFGMVELWVHTSGKKLAIKTCKRDVTQLTKKQQKRWINEVQIMKHLKHANIIKGLELPFKHPNDKVDLPVLCMEFCRKGDFRKVLNKVENCCGVSEKEAITVMKDISAAVEYLHSKNITHRDLKPENIVLQDEHNTIVYKLIDLGYAKELGETSTSGSLVGTLNYLAPELLWKQTYSCSVDYWSLGILFYEVVTGIRPFLPNMQHTTSWMQHIRNKKYDDICAFKSEGKIVFSQNITSPTNLSKCLKDKLVEWFKVVLQWNPKKRGKYYDKTGTPELVVFKLLHTILSKSIVYVFSVSTYSLNAYEMTNTSSIKDLQSVIEKDLNIPVNEQTLTDYFGKILVENHMPLLSQIQDPVLFVFKHENPLIEDVPILEIPVEIQKMIELSRKNVDFETLQDYYRITIFFFKQKMYLFQLYIFALTIKVDLVIARINTFNKNIMNALTDVNILLNKLSTVRLKWSETSIDKERTACLDKNFVKVNKLVKATNQIKLEFDSLAQKRDKLKEVVESIDCTKDMSEVYNEATEIYELHKNKYSHKSIEPTEMVKLVFKFLKIYETQFHNNNISSIIKQILKLETELTTLETIFNSVIAMRTIYKEEFKSMIQPSCNSMVEISNKERLNTASTMNKNIKLFSDEESMEVTDKFNSAQFSNTSIIRSREIMNKDDVVYDNLVIRYTLDNLLIKMQRKYLELLNLET